MDMAFVSAILSRQVVVATAVLAAVLVGLGSAVRSRQTEGNSCIPAMLIRIGYILFFVSIGIFVAAGFLNAGP